VTGPDARPGRSEAERLASAAGLSPGEPRRLLVERPEGVLLRGLAKHGPGLGEQGVRLTETQGIVHARQAGFEQIDQHAGDVDLRDGPRDARVGRSGARGREAFSRAQASR